MQQGYEPEIFKQAFPNWEPFARKNEGEISEEDESDSDSSDGSASGKDTGDGKSTAAATEADKALASELTPAEKRKIGSYTPESFWINL